MGSNIQLLELPNDILSTILIHIQNLYNYKYRLINKKLN